MAKLYFPEVPEWWAYHAALNANEDKSYGGYFIGHVLWQQYRLRKGSSTVKLPVSKLHKYGFGRSYIRTGLKSLEDAGLIKVKRFGHKSPEINLVIDSKAFTKSTGGNGNGRHKASNV